MIKSNKYATLDCDSDNENDGFTKVVNQKKNKIITEKTEKAKEIKKETKNFDISKFSRKPSIVKQNNAELETKNIAGTKDNIIAVLTKKNDKPVNSNSVETIQKETVNLEFFGSKKLNTKWTLWFHHDPNDWSITGYKQIFTFGTVEEYAKIMTRLHMVTSITNINLYLFREGIEPTWEHVANANGGCWSIKESMKVGFGVWKEICDKTVTETLLKTFGEADINGTINGVSITLKLMNTIIKIWVSDRKISNIQWIDKEIMSKISSKIMYQVISPEK
jgi:hypothetical protein